MIITNQYSYKALESLKVGDKITVRLMDGWLTKGPRTAEAEIVEIKKAHIEPDHRIVRLKDRKDQDAYKILYEITVNVEGEIKKVDFVVDGPNKQAVYRQYLKAFGSDSV